MSDVIKKMRNEVPETFFRLDVFLATNVTIPADHGSSAIQAVLLLPFRYVAHNKFLLK